MPYYVLTITDAGTLTAIESADAVAELLTTHGKTGLDAIGALAITVHRDEARLPPQGALLVGWTDDESRASLVSDLKEVWGEDVERVVTDPISQQAHSLAGSSLVGKDGDGNDVHVVACLEYYKPPGAPWQNDLEFETEFKGSLAISEIFRQ